MSKEGFNIEIGSGFGRFMHVVREDLLQGERLLYLDNNRKYFQKISEAHEVEEKFVQGDGTLLPFPDNSVELIFAKEFVGSLQIDDLGAPERIVPEWYRVCRPGGRAVIIETVSPFDPVGIVGVFLGVGFSEEERYSWNEVAELFRDKLFRSRRTLFRNDAYGLVFRKPALR